MSRTRRASLIGAIVAVINATWFYKTNVWFSLLWLVLGVLLSARYFSPTLRKSIRDNIIIILITYIVGFVLIGTFFFVEGNTEFALVFAFGTIIVAFLLYLEIWKIRTFS